MYFKTLELSNYRNYDKLNIEFSNGLNIFVGENAQGKTNIVEAVYYLGSLKSHRTPRDREMIKWNCERAYIKSELSKNSGNYTMEFLINNQDKKSVKINGINYSKMSEILGTANTIIFSPEDLKLVKDGPVLRRKFIDNELIQIRPKYHYALAQYNKVLAQRNNILKTIYKSPSMKTVAEVYGEQLAEYGSYIINVRHDFVRKLSMISKLIHRKITDGREELEIAYKSTSGCYNDIENIKRCLIQHYTQNIDEDVNKGYTLKGPHRDDLSIKINGIDTKAFGSQGQQRTAALSLKLSELDIIKSEVGEYPVLLLDDVLSELDTGRQRYLLDALKNVQTMLTCTSLNDIRDFHFDNKDIFTVKEGRIERNIRK
jgi:DNA replication and repair protein RecF